MVRESRSYVDGTLGLSFLDVRTNVYVKFCYQVEERERKERKRRLSQHVVKTSASVDVEESQEYGE